MNQEAKKEFDKINAKLDMVVKAQEMHKAQLKEFVDFEERVDKVVEGKVFEIKGLVYVILILVAVIFALIMGALLKTFFG